ncbi:MAG: zf-HC2 domain-containing protein, partial [Dehalococcoidia bacterium]|nr:zf-HC2 domain-containing protein [Dehalococcoidia bacterium]
MWWPSRRSKKNECLKTRHLLSVYLDRRLSAEQTGPVEDHLTKCERCREEAESLRATVALLRRLPQVEPARQFAVAPLRALPGHRALPALRLATAAAAVLLVAAFAVDWTGVAELKSPRDTYFVPASPGYEAEADYWLVPGVRNDILDSDNTSVKTSEVNLVVPDGSDDIAATVNSLASDGVVYGAIEPDPDGVPQLVLSKFAASAENSVQEFQVVAADDASPFAPSGPDTKSPIELIVSNQEGDYLNIVPANSDNAVLYAFKLDEPVPAELRAVPAAASGTGDSFGNGGRDWLRVAEYVLIGLV